MDKKISASYEATKTNEEIIKHKNVLVKKYDSFIKNYEEQLSYFKNEYNSRHKKNICEIIITFVFLITSVLLLIFAFKGILKPSNAFIVLGIGFGGFGLSIGLFLIDDITVRFSSSIKVIQHNYNVQENIIKNNNFKYFINTSKDKDSFIWDIEYSQGFFCKDFISHNNGTVEFTEYRDSQSIWNEENIDLKTHYEEIIDLSDNHILSVEEIKAHSYKDYAENKFLYKENEMKKKKENNRVTSGQVQVPQSPEMVLVKEDYHPIKFIIEEVKKRSKNSRKIKADIEETK